MHDRIDHGRTDPLQFEQQLERLVDGELDEPIRRALIEQLSETPDGWRRCALAFLEDQCWREALPSITSAAGEEDIASALARRPEKRNGRFTKRAAMNFFALAASLLITFTLGLSLGTSSTPTESPHPTDADVARDAAGTLPTTSGAASTNEELVQADLDGTQTVEPAEADPSARAWVLDPTTDLSAKVLAALELGGHPIKRQHEWWPAEFGDGHRGLVPVDRVEVQFSGYEIQ